MKRILGSIQVTVNPCSVQSLTKLFVTLKNICNREVRYSTHELMRFSFGCLSEEAPAVIKTNRTEPEQKI